MHCEIHDYSAMVACTSIGLAALQGFGLGSQGQLKPLVTQLESETVGCLWNHSKGQKQSTQDRGTERRAIRTSCRVHRLRRHEGSGHYCFSY